MNKGEDVAPHRYRGLLGVNLVAVAGGILLLILSLWPGFVVGCLIVLAYPLIAILGLIWLLLVIRAIPRPWGRGVPIRLAQILFAPVMVVLTYSLLAFYIPRRIAFRVHAHAFERQLNAFPATSRPAAFNGWLGIYHIDVIASDARGGTYFRTGVSADGLGPDQTSYGFAYHPDAEHTPFGSAHYVVRPITADWYWFEVSDDW